ncbi:chaperone protein dnaJ 6-like [Rhododendron vialii]|uniref:chaperone protein dnaJ 6-like n=1 Tax=Rhododendron vialii TaxID=182163 RepID=UPI00265F6A2A|nr:chaperone protein dnaJ 6-like [Rhododendron vialii]
MSILVVEEKRALNDQTGCVDDSMRPCRSFFRTMYRKITEADIEEFEANYRGSDSEKNDLIDLYKKYKGNMNSKSDGPVSLFYEGRSQRNQVE